MYEESDLLPISGLQHFVFCHRRWALVQIERIWEENRYTAEGRIAHERVHSGEIESRPGHLVRRSLALRSLRLGLTGQADVVEFAPSAVPGQGVKIAGRRGLWVPAPVEYKRRCDRVGSLAYRAQLCAQALCLEEMLETTIHFGYVYDTSTRRRRGVEFTADLRKLVASAAVSMQELYRGGRTPLPIPIPACRACSLVDACQPHALSRARSVGDYLAHGAGAP